MKRNIDFECDKTKLKNIKKIQISKDRHSVINMSSTFKFIILCCALLLVAVQAYSNAGDGGREKRQPRSFRDHDHLPCYPELGCPSEN